MKKANLRLDTLKPDLADERAMATWAAVFDKLAAGEMPPKTRKRPPQKELDATTTWLRTELHTASLDRHLTLARARPSLFAG